METKYITIPFDLERAKRISNHEEDGKIVTRDGRNVRIICWDAHRDDNIIALIEDEKGIEFPIFYVSDGLVFLKSESPADLMLSVPEWTTYKDGDILYAESIFGSYFIFVKKDGERKTLKYVSLMNKIDLSFESRCCCGDSSIKNIRKATKEEKQTIINALRLSKNELAKEYLKRFFNYKEEYKFEPFDKVLVRDGCEEKWLLSFFSYYDDEQDIKFCCLTTHWNYCIPYNEETKHLLGTTEDWEG